MKKVIKLSENSTISDSLKQLDKMLLNHNDSSDFNLLYNQAKSTVEDLIVKGKALSKTGTSLHILKEIEFQGLTLVLILDTPEKISLIDKLRKYLRLANG